MSKRVTKGIITGGVLGITVAMYALGKKLYRRKMMKNKKRILNRALTAVKGFNVF